MALQVYSASFDGTVRLWDFSGGKLLSTFNVGAPIKSLVSLNNSYRADGSLQTLLRKGWEAAPQSSHDVRTFLVQVVPSQGVHAYVVTAHTTGHNKGRVMRLNTVTGAVDPRAFSTSKPRPLAVSDMRTMALLHAYVPMQVPMPILHVSLVTCASTLRYKQAS